MQCDSSSQFNQLGARINALIPMIWGEISKHIKRNGKGCMGITIY